MIYNRDMNKLIYKGIRLTTRQVNIILEISKEKGISFTEYIRRIVDEHLDEMKKRPQNSS